VRSRRLADLAAAALVLAATFVVTGSAHAAAPTTLYVDNRPAANCSDAGTGTQTQPYCTISAAVGAVTPGETVSVLAANYAEHVTIARSGTPSQPITLDAPSLVFLTGANGGLTIDGQHDIVVRRFSVMPDTPSANTFAVDLANSSRISLIGITTSCPASSAILGIRLRYAYLDDVLVLVFAFWLRIRTALGVMAVGHSAVTRPASTWMRRLVRTASSIRRSWVTSSRVPE
jgi:hypothetical protein